MKVFLLCNDNGKPVLSDQVAFWTMFPDGVAEALAYRWKEPGLLPKHGDAVRVLNNPFFHKDPNANERRLVKIAEDNGLRFAELAAGSNPNALELFWLPPDCILLDTPRFARLRENRALFLSRCAVDTHIGYALAQIKKARGCNKRVEKRAKNMMHLVRLLLSGRNIVRNGEPIVRFEGAERDRLLSIRDGAWSFDEIMALAESLQADIRSAIDACPLPAEPDLAAIGNLLRELQP